MGATVADETCRTEIVDGQPVVVRGGDGWTDEDRAAFAEVVRAARRKFNAESDDWMLACDVCHVTYPAHEDLRGGGREALVEARRRAADDGWLSAAECDYCPEHESTFRSGEQP